MLEKTLWPRSDAIREKRLLLQLTKKELADKAGVSQKTVENAEAGRRIREFTLEYIAGVFGVLPGELAGSPPSPDSAEQHNQADKDSQGEGESQAAQVHACATLEVSLASAIELLRVGRYEEARDAFLRLAGANDTAAQGHLGWMYQHGIGVIQDYPQAVAWYRQAAEQGDPQGQHNLGWMCERGLGVPPDYGAALRWYTLAAQQGSAKAMNQLGWLHQHGYGVEKSHAEAMRWYKLAADAGNTSGMNNLGWMYEHGLGAPKDRNYAIQLYRMATEQGNADARGNLARLTMPKKS